MVELLDGEGAVRAGASRRDVPADGERKAQAELFRLCSACFMLPDDRLVGWLRADGLPAALADAHAGAYSDVPQDELLHRLRIEYTRLFLGRPEPLIHLHESLFLARAQGRETSAFIDPIALDVKAAYTKAHVKGAPDKNDPLDSIYAECEFLYYLLSVGDAGCLALYDDFRSRHFDRWAGSFAKRVGEETEEPLFLFACALLKELVG